MHRIILQALFNVGCLFTCSSTVDFASTAGGTEGNSISSVAP